MLKNFFKIAFRNLKKNKFHTFINIFSLSVGISACLLIFLYINSELSYDKYHKNADRIYRVSTELDIQGKKDLFAVNSASTAQKLVEFYPEIENYCRIIPLFNEVLNIEYREEIIKEKNACLADSTLLDFFDYKLLKGNRDEILNEPNTIIISDEKAIKYFGSIEKAINQSLTLANNSIKKLKIVGIFEKEKRNTHLNFDIFISLNTLPKEFWDRTNEDMMWMNSIIYVMFKKGIEFQKFKPKLAQFYKKRVKPWLKKHEGQGVADKIIYHFQALPDVHLSNNLQYDFASNGNPAYIYIFSFIGIFILLIASINYMNLATAKSVKRAKEVGVRKVMGANKQQLVRQFLGEAFLITFLAYLLGLVLVEFLLPIFNYLTGKSLHFIDLLEPSFLLYSLLGLIFLALLSGSYPAFYLARFKPALVLKSGVIDKVNQNSFSFFLTPKRIRKILVIKQFTLSVIMIISTVIVFSQLKFMQNKNLGLNKEQVLVIDMPQDSMIALQIKSIKQELEKNSNILKVATSNSLPSIRGGRISNVVEEDGKNVTKVLNTMVVSADFFDVLDIPIIKGRNFSNDMRTDDSTAIIINEATMRYLRWQKPIHKKLRSSFRPAGKVIGVVKDFHYVSLANPIEPLTIMYSSEVGAYILLKLNEQGIEEAISHVNRVWKDFKIKYPLEYFFLDDNFRKLYDTEEKTLLIYAYFAILTIIISCLGLFALASFTTEQRLKEIGIRKVLGASNMGITKLISKDFLWLVIIANIIAIPFTLYFMNQWLNDFAYRISLDWIPFFLSSSLTIMIALLTVSLLALKAANNSPIKVLKYE